MVDFAHASEWSSETVLRLTVVFASLSVLVSSLEYLKLLPHFSDRGLFAPRMFGTHRIAKWASACVRFVLSPGGVALVMTVRMLAATWCLVLPFPDLIAPLTLLVVAQCIVHYRCRRCGMEGSDMMTMILLVMCWAAAVCRTEPIRVVALGFIAVQSCLAYFFSGMSKLGGTAWRSGTAVRDILRTRIFGHRQVWLLFHRSARLTKVVTYFVILFECIFPLVLLLPTPLAAAFLALGCLFHLGNAVAMGLNVFVWAFLGTYPAILYWSNVISARI